MRESQTAIITPVFSTDIPSRLRFDKQLSDAPAFLKEKNAIWVRPNNGWLTLQSANGEGAVSSMVYATIMAIIILAIMTKVLRIMFEFAGQGYH